jgi:hypothetical protein
LNLPVLISMILVFRLDILILNLGLFSVLSKTERSFIKYLLMWSKLLLSKLRVILLRSKLLRC